MPEPTRIRVVRRDPAELSDRQIETLIGFGRREAELVDSLVEATRAGDHDAVWAISQAIARVEDQVAEVSVSARKT